MGYKNRYHKEKRILSSRKFERIFAANLDKAGIAYRTIKWNTERSLAACKVGDIIYARFACKTQKTDKLDTFCIRYKVDENPLDFIAFSMYPKHVSFLLATLDIGGELF